MRVKIFYNLWGQDLEDAVNKWLGDAKSVEIIDRTYAVARLCARPACGKPHRTALGSVKNCCIAGRIMSSLVAKRVAPVCISCQISRRYVRSAHPI